MPISEDFPVATGPLRLKGVKPSKVDKKKKKKKTTDASKDEQQRRANLLSRAIDEDEKPDYTASSSTRALEPDAEPQRRKLDRVKRGVDEGEEDPNQSTTRETENEEELPIDSFKTEAERRFEEAQRKRLRKLAEQPDKHPQLLKTHKQRVEELNTYLSRLSEHHDMPKIGPG